MIEKTRKRRGKKKRPDFSRSTDESAELEPPRKIGSIHNRPTQPKRPREHASGQSQENMVRERPETPERRSPSVNSPWSIRQRHPNREPVGGLIHTAINPSDHTHGIAECCTAITREIRKSMKKPQPMGRGIQDIHVANKTEGGDLLATLNRFSRPSSCQTGS